MSLWRIIFAYNLMSTAHGEFILGQYRIGNSIGEGTFGKVRLGIHIPTSQKVAVKTLQKQKIVEQADIERVTRQICILKILRHPNIIQLYQIIETKSDIHLIMEYAEGGELFDYIVKKKRLDEKQAVSFMQQILSGVEYIHKNGIVHRDLKPQNLLLDQNKNIKIVDFGLSNHYKQGEKLKTACGSPCYAAPEMIAGKKYECLPADIWSCGIILYAMLCGFLPFEDPNTNKLYKKIMAGEYETPKILTPDSKQMLKGILNTNPELRYRIQQIKSSKWFNQLGTCYNAQGIIIGKDFIEPNEQIIKKMQSFNIDPTQSRNYLVNNRHNQITAFYYLLKIKAQRDPSFHLEQVKHEPKTIEKRQESPLIYRPNTEKTYYIPTKKATVKENKDSSKNDSMNVSNIITSLVEANKGKIAANRFSNPKKQSNFDKLEESKLFPNKKNSSIYEPSNRGNSTNRSEEKSLQYNKIQKKSTIEPPEYTKANISINQGSSLENTVKLNEQTVVSKKRQQLSDQLKQISQKIDKQISELRKQNNITSNSVNSTSISKKRQSIDANLSNSIRLKTANQQGRSAAKSTSRDPSGTASKQHSKDYYLNISKERAGNISKQNPNFTIQQRRNTSNSRDKEISSHFSNSKQKMSFYKEREGREAVQVKSTKIHNGPFNSQCVFMENAKILYDKIIGTLTRLKMRYQQVDTYTLSLGTHIISIQSVQNIPGIHVIKFNSQNPINQTIIDVLTK